MTQARHKCSAAIRELGLRRIDQPRAARLQSFLDKWHQLARAVLSRLSSQEAPKVE
jgi:hypothetical protein